MTLRQPHYAWIVMAVTFVTLILGSGVRSAPGVLMVPLEAEFHWSRGTISFAVAVNLLLYGLLGPFSAAMMERFGLRRIMLFAVTTVGIGVGLTAVMREAWQLVLLWGVVVGFGAGCAAQVLGATVAARWFTAQRGLVVGILASSAAAGQLIFLPAFASLVTGYGWRATVVVIVATALAILPIVYFLMRDRPEDIGLKPYGETGETKPAAKLTGNPVALAFTTLFAAARHRDFWLLTGSFFVCGASTNGLIGTHLIPACLDYGIPEMVGAGLLATMGLLNFGGTTLSGWLSDRVDNRILLMIYYGLRGLSLLCLPFSFVSFYGLSLFAIFYGLDWIATVPPTVRLTAATFGREKAGIVFGWVFASHQLGSAFAAYFAGEMRTDLGSYMEAFIISGLLCFVAAGMVLLIGRDRPAPETGALLGAARV
jgi:sugar phosphate permease